MTASSSSFESPWFTKRLIGWGLGVILLILLILPKIVSSDEGDQNQNQESAPLSVDAYVVTPTTISDRLQTTGTLRANESVELTSETSGRITSIQFEEGTRVEKGQLLLTTNDAELQAERKRLEHRLELAETREQRQRRLLEEGGVSQEEYDDTQNQVSVLQSELDLVEARIAKTRVHAPFSGVIGLRAVSEGSYLSPQSRITLLQDLNPIKVDFSVPGMYSGRIQEGSPITFSVRGADRSYEGDIYAIEPQIDNDTRTLQLRARTANEERRLRPGAFADVTVLLDTIDDALMVPSEAVIPELGGQRVLVAENGEAQIRSVEVGLRTDTTVQVTEGLSARDTVLTSGFQEAQPGTPLQITIRE